MITNLPITISKEIREKDVYFELNIGRQVVSSVALTRGTSDGRALVLLLDRIPRA